MNYLLLHFDCLLSLAPVWRLWTRDCPRELFVRFWGRETPDKRSNNLDVFLRKNSRQPENINIFGCFTSAQIFMIKINLRHHNPHSVVMTKTFWRQNTNYQIHTDLTASKSLWMKDKHLHQNCRINIYICILISLPVIAWYSYLTVIVQVSLLVFVSHELINEGVLSIIYLGWTMSLCLVK